MELVLYKKDSCPFCQKVMHFIDQNSVSGIEYKDIVRDPENEKVLIEKGGMDQVPCLFIDGKPLYESDDIIAWLKENLLHVQDIKGEEEDPGVCNVF
ncbi:MAG: glutaredoxin [Peptoniphilaceae bacterium]|nr:glutaredoxin [Peptoniphilaceae bacterium]MDY5765450.1 glutaredoxin [Peptoniphilaceae bacterium]